MHQRCYKTVIDSKKESRRILEALESAEAAGLCCIFDLALSFFLSIASRLLSDIFSPLYFDAPLEKAESA